MHRRCEFCELGEEASCLVRYVTHHLKESTDGKPGNDVKAAECLIFLCTVINQETFIPWNACIFTPPNGLTALCMSL